MPSFVFLFILCTVTCNASFETSESLLLVMTDFITENSRLGDKIDLIPVSHQESIDIDNYEDWWVAERLLQKKRIIIKADASHEIGTGHIYRGLAIASKLINHDVLFLLDEEKEIGIDNKSKEIEMLDGIVKNANYLSQTIEDFRDFYNPTTLKVDFLIGDCINKCFKIINPQFMNKDIIIKQDIEEFNVLENFGTNGKILTITNLNSSNFDEDYDSVQE